MTLDIQKEISEIQRMYNESVAARYFNAIIYGGFGSGKTHMLRTCRLPVFVDSFDPGGQKTNKVPISEGKIVVDTRWENEDPMNPKVIADWDKVYHDRKKSGFFNHFATYVIDSTTTWSDAFVFKFLKDTGRPGGFLYQQDYNPVMAKIATAMRDIMTLPCDVIFICHEDTDKDESTGRMFNGPSLVGKSQRNKVPILFDEVYSAQSKEAGPDKTEYRFLTRNTGMYRARTRIGSDGKFAMWEPQDIKALLKKAGFPTEDKPLFKQVVNQ